MDLSLPIILHQIRKPLKELLNNYLRTAVLIWYKNVPVDYMHCYGVRPCIIYGQLVLLLP